MEKLEKIALAQITGRVRLTMPTDPEERARFYKLLGKQSKEYEKELEMERIEYLRARAHALMLYRTYPIWKQS